VPNLCIFGNIAGAGILPLDSPNYQGFYDFKAVIYQHWNVMKGLIAKNLVETAPH